MKRKLIQNLIISYLIILSFSILLISYSLISTYRQSQTNILQMQQMMLEQSKNNIDNYVLDIRNDLQSLFTSYPILKFTSSTNELKPYDYYDFYKIIQSLKNKNIGDNIFVAYKNSSIVISNRASYTFSDFFHVILKEAKTSEQEFYEDLFEINPLINWFTHLDSTKAENGDIFLIKQSIDYQQNNPSTIAFCILDTKDLLSMMGQIENENQGNIMLLAEDGKIIDSQFIGNYNEDTDIFQSVKSTMGPWQYAITQPREVLMKSVYLSIKVIYISAIIGILFLLLIAVIALRSNNKCVSHIVDINQEMLEQLNKQIPYVKHDFYKNLLEGRFESLHQIEICSNIVGVNIDRKYYKIIVNEINIADSEQKLQDDYIKDIRIKMMNLKKMIPEGPVINYLYDISYNKFVIICSNDDVSTLDNKVGAITNSILESAGTIENFIVYIGVGDLQSNLIDISISYNQAKCALLNISVYSKSSIKYFTDMVLDKQGFVFSEQSKNLIINSVCSGDMKGMKETMRNVIVSNILDKDLSEEAMQLFLLQFYDVINRIKNSITIQDAQLLEDIENLLSDSHKIESVYKLHKIQSILQRTTSHVYGMKKLYKDNLIYQMRDFINHNYTNPDLNLQMISNEYDISEAYISQLFKKVLDINFFKYLEDLRLNEACKLLDTTDYSIHTIAERSGYCSINTFGRAFKRKYHISATEYRNMNSDIAKKSLILKKS